MAGLLTPGFYGKLPSAGDFVRRGLPLAFVGPWDRWLARHLTHLAADAPPLFFRLSGFSGTVLPSHDRAGRPFPLTLAVAGNPDAVALASLVPIATSAIAEALSPDALADRLATAPLPEGPADPVPLLLWTGGSAARPADPDAPAPVLAALLARTA